MISVQGNRTGIGRCCGTVLDGIASLHGHIAICCDGCVVDDATICCRQDDILLGVKCIAVIEAALCRFADIRFGIQAARRGQRTFVVYERDACCGCNRAVDIEVVGLAVRIIADGDILGLAALGEGYLQVFIAAVAEHDIRRIAGILQRHILECIEFLGFRLCPAVQTDACRCVHRSRLCRDGMGCRLLDGAARRKVQDIGIEAAVVQQRRSCRIDFDLASLDAAFYRSIRIIAAGLDGAFTLQDEFVFAIHLVQRQRARLLASDVDIAILCVGAQDTAVLDTDGVIGKTEAASRRNEAHLLAIDVARRLALLRRHDHTGIRREIHLPARDILDGQHLGSTAVESRLVQVDVPCHARIERAGEVRQDLVRITAHVALAARDDEVVRGDAALRHLDAIVAHELDVLCRLDLARDIEHRVLDAGNVDIARVLRLLLVGVERQLAAVQLYRQRFLLLDDHRIILPGQIAGLRLREELEVLDLREVIVGNRFGCIVNTDIQAGIEHNVPALDVRRIDRHHFILRRRVEDAVLDGVEQVVPAPAVGIAAIDFTVVQDEILFLCRIVLALEISLASLIVGLERLVKGCLAFVFRHGRRLALECLDLCLIGFLGGLQFFTARCIRGIGESLCLIVGKGMLALAFRGELLALHGQRIQPLFLGRRRCSRMAVIDIGVADKAHFLPECHLVQAARERPVADGIFKASIRCQIHVTTVRDDVTDAHRAIAVLQGDVPLCLCIDAGRHGVAVERFRRCRHIRRNDSVPADEIDAVAREHRACRRLQIAVGLQVEIAVLDAGFLDVELAIAREQRHTALVTREADIGGITQCTVIQGNILQSAGRQVIRIDDRTGLGFDTALLAGKRHRPATAGGSDVAYQVNILAARNGDGIILSLQEADFDGFVRMDGICTASRTRCRLRPAIGNLTGEMRPVIILLRLDDFTARRRPTGFSRRALILRLLSAGRDEGTLPQQRAGWKVRSRRFQLACRGIDTLEELIGRTVLDQRPEREILGVRFLLDGFITRGTARPLHGLGSRLIHHTAGVIRIGGTRALTIRRRRFSRNHTVIVPIFRQGILVGILDADEPIQILIPDGPYHQILVYLSGIDGNGSPSMATSRPLPLVLASAPVM